MRIRGEAPATGRLEPGGVMPGVAPAVLDSPPPGSLQGSPMGIGEVTAGHVPPDEQDAWTEGNAGGDDGSGRDES